MNTVEKGDALENRLFDYLSEQQSRGELLFGVYSPTLSKIKRKPKYYCTEREADIEFDVAIEVFRQSGREPHFYVIFECKNLSGSVAERKLTDFSDKLARVRKHNSKGVVVTATKLQKGATKIAQKRGLAIVKFDSSGLDVIAERKGGFHLADTFVAKQFHSEHHDERALRFSGFYCDNYYGSSADLLAALDPDVSPPLAEASVLPYLTPEKLSDAAESVRSMVRYVDGPVDLNAICSEMKISLNFIEGMHHNQRGVEVLGWANFSNNSITIAKLGSEFRERFTIAHEIGHIALNHGKFIVSEAVLERNLVDMSSQSGMPDFVRLEVQANVFASELLLPNRQFMARASEIRDELGILDRGHGYIFVDDQPWNEAPFNELIGQLKTFYGVSKRAIEIRLKARGMLNDQRINSWKRAKALY